MGFYLKRRLLQTIPLLLIIAILCFILIHQTPGGPLSVYTFGRKIAPRDIERIKDSLGLNKPLYWQFFYWLRQVVFYGDLGYSYVTWQPVSKLIWERLPNTVILMFSALFLSILFAFPIGIFSALKKYSLFDYVATTFSFIGYSIPIFWLGLMAQLVFSVKLGLLPSGGVRTPGLPFNLLDRIKYLVLPSFVLALTFIASWSRYMRASLLGKLRENYVITARAKGLSEVAILFKHVLRNALIPVVTIVGLQLPLIFSGAVITETIFAWPGIGRLLFHALLRRDYPLIQGILLISSLVVILSNLLADIAYAYINPRIRYE